MKKRILSICMVAAFCLSSVCLMTGCGDKEPYANYDLSEYVKVGEYKGLEYKKIKVKVTDTDIKTEISSRLAAAAEEKSVKTGIVKDGDKIDVSFEGRIDGKTFDGGTAESFEITVGTTQMIDGFVEGLIGVEVGETVTLDLKFPEDYGKEELNGKDVVFTVKIKSKVEKVIPDYNLEFIKAHSDFDNFDDYEASVKDDLLMEKESEAESEMKSLLWEKIVSNSEILKYPVEKDNLIETTLNSFKKTAADNNMEWDAYLEELGYTEESLNTQLISYAETKVFQEMIVHTIAKKEGITVSNEEYEAYMDDMLAQSGIDAETFESYYGMSVEEYCEQEGLRTSLLLGKVMEKVKEYGVEK
ncbi:MAG: trigger factor [Firmicutes bacterium]|nr:trigger factor [Bacillota bacterium]